jgi:hypothetical protein
VSGGAPESRKSTWATGQATVDKANAAQDVLSDEDRLENDFRLATMFLSWSAVKGSVALAGDIASTACAVRRFVVSPAQPG